MNCDYCNCVSVLIAKLTISILARIESANPCTFSPYTDGCGNHGWLWNCSHRSLTKIPQDIPIKYKDNILSLDLSWNNFREFQLLHFKIYKQTLAPTL